MNKATIILLLISLYGCNNNQSSDNTNASNHLDRTVTANLLPNNTKTLFIDLKKSVVAWKGTKMMRTGKHEGTVNFKFGKLSFSDGKLVGGEFVVDMKSIYITDIPISDPEPRKNLTTHLNKDFETKIYPTASFIITKVEQSNTELYNATGNMTIKGISKSISITVKEIEREKEYFSTFTFDRFLWKIGENGSWLEKKLVDADITLKIKIVLLNK